jgi:hypothetical protein
MRPCPHRRARWVLAYAGRSGVPLLPKEGCPRMRAGWFNGVEYTNTAPLRRSQAHRRPYASRTFASKAEIPSARGRRAMVQA